MKAGGGGIVEGWGVGGQEGGKLQSKQPLEPSDFSLSFTSRVYATSMELANGCELFYWYHSESCCNGVRNLAYW